MAPSTPPGLTATVIHDAGFLGGRFLPMSENITNAVMYIMTRANKTNPMAAAGDSNRSSIQVPSNLSIAMTPMVSIPSFMARA